MHTYAMYRLLTYQPTAIVVTNSFHSLILTLIQPSGLSLKCCFGQLPTTLLLHITTANLRNA